MTSQFLKVCVVPLVLPALSAVTVGIFKGASRRDGFRMAEDMALGFDLLVAALVLQATLLAGRLEDLGVVPPVSQDDKDLQLVALLTVVALLGIMALCLKAAAKEHVVQFLDPESGEPKRDPTTDTELEPVTEWRVGPLAALVSTIAGGVILTLVLAANLFMLADPAAD